MTPLIYFVGLVFFGFLGVCGFVGYLIYYTIKYKQQAEAIDFIAPASMGLVIVLFWPAMIPIILVSSIPIAALFGLYRLYIKVSADYISNIKK